jgi:hypothetical protein
MNRLEMEYTALFAGKVWRERKNVSYTLIPLKEMSGKPIQVFKFSERTGPGDIASKEGTTVNLLMTPELKTRDITIISGKQAGSATTSGLSDKLFYRIPDVVNLKITLGNEILYNSRKLVYQFGEVIQLPANYLIGK